MSPAWRSPSSAAALGLLSLTLSFGCQGLIEDPGAGPPRGSRWAGPGGGQNCEPSLADRSRVSRLTHSQFDNTVRELFGDPSLTPSQGLPPEAAGSLDARGWSGYRAAAATLAENALADASVRDRIVPCASAVGDRSCATEFVSSFGRRAFRRPLAAEEVERYLGLFDRRSELTSNGGFDEGIQLIIEALLQSPSFLTLAERSSAVVDGSVPLDGYEVASRLSYALWNSMPDEPLFRAAEQGGLLSPAGLEEEVRRMLSDSRAREVVREFHDRWLGIQGSEAAQWVEIVRDSERFPDYTDSMAPRLVEETRRFVEHVVFDRVGGFQDLLTLPVGFVNRELAPLYGLNPANYGDELEAVDLDPARRAGVFTRLGFLASHATFGRTSPILRGAYLAKDVLCRSIGSPPPDAESAPLPESDSNVVTTRDRVALQTSPPACAGCHETLINPIGFAFEHYDAVGAWRDAENGAPVDASGDFVIDGVPVAFAGGVDFSAAVASSREARLCYARDWVEFFHRREATPRDQCDAEHLADRLAGPGYGVLDLLAELTQSPDFVRRVQ